MIEAPVTYATYWVLFLHQEPTITSTYRLARDFCFYTGTRSPVMSIFVIVTTIFALAYPTFVNSMSGYVTDNSPYIEVETGTMVPLFNFTKLAYVIHDGDRVGLSKEYNVLDMTRGTSPCGSRGFRGRDRICC